MEVLCEGLPACFLSYMNYCRNLKFEQKPDYKYIKGLFDQTFVEFKYEADGRFDWVVYKENKLEEKHRREKEIREEEAARARKLGKQRAPNKRE